VSAGFIIRQKSPVLADHVQRAADANRVGSATFTAGDGAISACRTEIGNVGDNSTFCPESLTTSEFFRPFSVFPTAPGAHNLSAWTAGFGIIIE
jgi:hypothetical protein